MLERIWKARRDERGFTLIELIMVLVILGILLALALPSYLGTRRKAYIAEADQKLQEWATAQWLYYTEHNAFAAEGNDAGQVPLPEDTDNWDFQGGDCGGATDSCTATAVGQGRVAGASVVLTISSNGSRAVSSGGF